ncbi:MAG: VWA domain-containing protein [Polyangiaceae bacterium]|nr:VWA domain-containing protein [Myxococcales bacterium]MCB9585149.1 VWA domain-containing protein [Polyangiaceae bacterium]
MRAWRLGSIFASLVVYAACSASEGDPAATGGAAGTGGASGSSGQGGSAGSSAQGGSAGFLDADVPDNHFDLDAACVGTSVKPEHKPLGSLLVVDRSKSMDVATGGGTRWQALNSALTSFLADTDTEALQLGLVLFPEFLSGSPPSSCVDDNDCGAYGPCQDLGSFDQCFAALGSAPYVSCEAVDYAPTVAIGPATSVASGITSSIAGVTPAGNTPTSAALLAAIDSLRSWGADHTDHHLAVILATDGDPTDCLPTDANSIAQIAADGLAGSPSVSTFVLGVGINSSPLQQIAAAGTEPDVGVVFADVGSNASQNLTDALRSVRIEALGCDFLLPEGPPGQTLDYGKINFSVYSGGQESQVPRVSDANQCGNEAGWYYTGDPSMPTGITACPAVCDQLKSGSVDKVEYLLGCDTVVK